MTRPPAEGSIAVRLQPRARRAEVVGVPPSRVTVVRGSTSRDKVVRVEGADAASVRAALLRP